MTGPTPLTAARELEEQDGELWVSAKDSVHVISRRLYRAFTEDPTGHVDIACIGATSLNQAVKGAAACRQLLRQHGHDLVLVPWFSDTVVEGEERTRIMLRVWLLSPGEEEQNRPPAGEPCTVPS